MRGLWWLEDPAAFQSFVFKSFACATAGPASFSAVVLGPCLRPAWTEKLDGLTLPAQTAIDDHGA